jgi:hypothetical protein
VSLTSTIQPQEYSRGGGPDGTPYNTASDGNPNVFNVDHDEDDRWLNTNWSNPDDLWNPDNRFVFCYSFHFPST